MTLALRAPLVAAACLSVALALLSTSDPFACVALGGAAGALGVALARASADRQRRVLWTACAASALAMAARPLVPASILDLTPLSALAARVREPLAAALHTLVPAPESGILLGIVLGERSSIGRDLREAFAVSGTTHLLAISGFNMTLVATAVAFGLRGRVPPVVVAVVTVAAVGAYTVLVGAGASVVRAALMAAVGSLALAIGRASLAANALAAAVIAMLIGDPFAIEDVGFILSVAATAGLIAWERAISARLTFMPALLRDGLAATVAASLPTIPIVAAVFGRVSLVSPLANLVAVPLFVPIMAFGAATATVGGIARDVAAPLAMVAYASAWALRHTVELAAAVPYAAIEVPRGPTTAVAIAVATCLCVVAGSRSVALLRPRVRLRLPPLRLPQVGAPALPSVRVAAIAVATLVLSAAAVTAMPRPSGTRLHALDVGQGDAFLIESEGRYALIDGGPDRALLLRRLGEVLPPWHRRIDVVVLTHEHADHGIGLIAVLDRFEVGLAIEPSGMADLPLTRMWWERLERSRVPRRTVAAGTVVRVGGVALHVLAPGERRVAVPSLVIRASAAAGSILFMGDATDDAIADLLLAPEGLAARVYVPPHHGADTAHAAALVAAIRPAAAVISSGAANRYGHPTPGTLAALADVPVYRTDRYGTVVISLDADPFTVRTAKAGLPPDRGGSLPRASPAR